MQHQTPGAKLKEAAEYYLHERTSYWSASTLKSERARINTIQKYVETSGLNGQEFLKALKGDGYNLYNIKQMFVRAGQLYSFGQERGLFAPSTNPFKDFMLKEPLAFKNAYKKQRLTLSYEQALEQIEAEPSFTKEMRSILKCLLRSGLRIHEAYKVNRATMTVEGKGGKERRVFNFDFPADWQIPPYHAVRTALHKLGIKGPHTLRKLFANFLARSQKFTREDIMTIVGWSDYRSAASYMQSLHETELQSRLDTI